MTRKGIVFHENFPAGEVWEDDDGVHFRYLEAYLALPEAMPVSLTLPLRVNEYFSEAMLPFFDGLIPEGWLLDIAGEIWKINPRDRMGLLLACCQDCIGAVSVQPVPNEAS